MRIQMLLSPNQFLGLKTCIYIQMKISPCQRLMAYIVEHHGGQRCRTAYVKDIAGRWQLSKVILGWLSFNVLQT